jgi:hypothetical protein
MVVGLMDGGLVDVVVVVVMFVWNDNSMNPIAICAK